MQSYRVLQDTHYYILLTVGTGIQVSGRFKNELSETQTRISFVLANPKGIKNDTTNKEVYQLSWDDTHKSSVIT